VSAGAVPEANPRGAYAPGSWCCANVCRRKAICAMHERTFTRAAGVSPPWFSKGSRLQGEANNVWRTRTAESGAATVSPPWVLGKRTCRNASAKSRMTAGGVLVNAGAGPVANPRGVYAPRSYVAVRVFAGEKTIFAMHERTFTRAAGVSPPWVCKPSVQRQRAGFPRFEFAYRVHPTGGLRPPLLLQSERLSAKNDFCDARTRVRKSGRGQPAVVR
jgi:hypothetical protein